ncbi:hypothetical protein [Clostridium massiliamazoniense]|uniref:hypothetical protein n=1 Tax=Clostridium massiliamazoniense TaxID=1347366 RepID=UPI0006D82E68|nr:hypothetical protein [Clostridium massiliamazoniense]
MEGIKIFLKKNKNFNSNEYVENFNRKRIKFAKIMIILILMVNIMLLNINAMNKKRIKSLDEKTDIEKVTENIEINNNEITLEKIKFLENILKESRVYDLDFQGNNLSFKIDGIYSDWFILELSNLDKFNITNINYNNDESYIQVRGEIV